ncbi:MFS transporter [Streptomyces sp. NPDC088341]|uniref:MFS transporter n=1 Tax=Streptomyces sp. NPDC088341 TaxID=3154870 RepID=UPI00343DDB5F
MSPGITLLLAVACGSAVANVYFAQPLLVTLGHDFAMSPAALGAVVTLTQIGYGLGLFFLVPLGDLVDRRRLISVQLLLLAAALTLVGTATTGAVLLVGMAVVGLLAVVTQTLVAFAASLAPTARRGSVVGLVTSGVVTGILLARTVSGLLADQAGWRSVYLTSAALTCVLALTLHRALPSRTPPSRALPSRTPPSRTRRPRAVPSRVLPSHIPSSYAPPSYAPPSHIPSSRTSAPPAPRAAPRPAPPATSPAVLSYGRLLRSTVTLFARERLLRIRALLALLIFAAFSTLWSCVALPLSAPPFSLPDSAIGAFGLAGAAGALAATAAGRLNDRGLPRWTTGIGLVLLSASWVPLALTRHSLWALVVGVIVLDLAVQAVHVTSQSLIHALAPDAGSRLFGGYMIFYSIGSATGAIASTSLYAAAGWGAVCVLGASFSCLALLVWALTERSSAPPQR